MSYLHRNKIPNEAVLCASKHTVGVMLSWNCNNSHLAMHLTFDRTLADIVCYKNSLTDILTELHLRPAQYTRWLKTDFNFNHMINKKHWFHTITFRQTCFNTMHAPLYTWTLSLCRRHQQRWLNPLGHITKACFYHWFFVYSIVTTNIMIIKECCQRHLCSLLKWLHWMKCQSILNSARPSSRCGKHRMG